MLILGVMCFGIIVGNRLFQEKHKRKNEYLQIFCTVLLIFSMGVMLGKKENFFTDLASLGLKSFLYFIIPTGLSLFFVYFLTTRFMNHKDKEIDEKEQKEK